MTVPGLREPIRLDYWYPGVFAQSAGTLLDASPVSKSEIVSPMDFGKHFFAEMGSPLTDGGPDPAVRGGSWRAVGRAGGEEHARPAAAAERGRGEWAAVGAATGPGPHPRLAPAPPRVIGISRPLHHFANLAFATLILKGACSSEP